MPGAAIDAVLLDFNGVLLEDEVYHWLAYRDVLAPLGIRLTRRRYERRYLVFDDRTALERMLRDAGRPLDGVTLLLRRKRRAYLAHCGPELRIDPRVARLVRDLSRRCPLAVVSGAPRREIRRTLEAAGLASFFATVTSAEDVARRKPHPDLYLKAMRRLRRAGHVIDPARCLAVEDSPGGIRAARAAGVPVIGIASTYPAGVLRRSGAARVARSLASLRVSSFLRG